MYKKYILGMLLMGLCMGATFAADWNLPGVTIISRANRGANESLRYSPLSKADRDKISQKNKDAELQLLRDTDGEGTDSKLRNVLQQRYQLQMANDFLVTNYSGEQSTDAYYDSYNSNYLKWPVSIHNNKTKIIIHHTADDYTKLLTGGLDAVKTSIQNIYKYHTVTKGWGDIGYNFLIDPFGNIYEGRAGGPGTIGAHAAWNNTSTLGIALMGNFNIQKPTDEQLKALVSLSIALAKKYNINPMAKVSYFKPSDRPPYITTVTSYAVAGHKDDGQATACPGTNLYSLLPDIRTQIKNGVQKNLLSNVVASGATADILILTGLHYATLGKISFTLPLQLTAVTSCMSLDTGFVVESCTVKNGVFSITLVRKAYMGEITKNIKITIPAGKDKTTFKIVSFPLLWKDDLTKMGNDLQTAYMKNKNLSVSTTVMTKIGHKILLSELKGYLAGMINVLLYDLSMNYHRWEITCDGLCRVITNGSLSTKNSIILESYDGFLYLTSGENSITPDKVEIASMGGGLVTVSSYARKSYGGTPWNTFRGSLVFKNNPVKNLASGGKIENRFIIINRLLFNDYMKGIGETSDTDNMTKQSLVLMLAKMYALFYLNPANMHPSIPVGASYTAIDNPDMFQKYVGAGWEKTSKTSAQALENIKKNVVLYSGYVPILPYFSCSAGFTWSAKDKRGWTDTPYLQSRFDFASCFDFNGHGVGLSGKGAQYLADQGWNLKKILEYYYPGVNLTMIK